MIFSSSDDEYLIRSDIILTLCKYQLSVSQRIFNLLDKLNPSNVVAIVINEAPINLTTAIIYQIIPINYFIFAFIIQ